MSASWTKGIWNVQNDTIFFKMIPIYDTLRKENSKGFVVDTLILSDDEIPERVILIRSAIFQHSLGGQNRMAYPEELLFKKGRLYKIKNGSLVLNKSKGYSTRKKFNQWYYTTDD